MGDSDESDKPQAEGLAGRVLSLGDTDSEDAEKPGETSAAHPLSPPLGFGGSLFHGQHSQVVETEHAPQSEADDFVRVVQAVAAAAEPFAREQSRAEIEKARLELEAHKVTVGGQVEDRRHSREVGLKHASLRERRFLVTLGVATLFGLIVLGISGTLIFMGQLAFGAGILASALSFVAGRMSNRRLPQPQARQLPSSDDEETE